MLLVDLDPQACLTFCLGVDPEDVRRAVHDVLLGKADAAEVLIATEDGVDLLPSVIELAGAEAQLLPRPGREYVLRSALEPVAGRLRLGAAGLLALARRAHAERADGRAGAAHPAAVRDALATAAWASCSTPSHDVRRILNPDLEVLGILPTMFDGRTNHARAVLADVGERYDLPVLEPPIPKTVRFAEAPAVGRSILTTSRSSKGAQAYRDVAAGLLARL